MNNLAMVKLNGHRYMHLIKDEIILSHNSKTNNDNDKTIVIKDNNLYTPQKVYIVDYKKYTTPPTIFDYEITYTDLTTGKQVDSPYNMKFDPEEGSFTFTNKYDNSSTLEIKYPIVNVILVKLTVNRNYRNGFRKPEIDKPRIFIDKESANITLHYEMFKERNSDPLTNYYFPYDRLSLIDHHTYYTGYFPYKYVFQITGVAGGGTPYTIMSGLNIPIGAKVHVYMPSFGYNRELTVSGQPYDYAYFTLDGTPRTGNVLWLASHGVPGGRNPILLTYNNTTCLCFIYHGVSASDEGEERERNKIYHDMLRERIM